MEIGTIVALALIIISPITGYLGWKRYKVLKQITGIEQKDIREISSTGEVELSGTIKADEELTAPFTQENGVLSAWKIDEWTERGDVSNWATTAKGIHTTPFTLVDETGEITVDIDEHITEGGETLGFKNPTQSALDDGDSLFVETILTHFDGFSPVGKYEPGESPDHYKQFFNELEKTGEAKGSITNKIDFGTKHGERKYYEQTLKDGDEIYILGQVESEYDEGHLRPEDATITAANDGLTVISTISEDELTKKLQKQVKALAVITVATLPIGILLYLFL